MKEQFIDEEKKLNNKSIPRKKVIMNNICMISQSAYPYDPRIRRQAEKLARNGFKVDIICIPAKNDSKSEYFNNGITAYRVVKNTGQESVRKYLWLSLRFFIASFIKLQKLNRIKRYKLIQIHNMPETHVFTTILQKLKGTPILLDIHDLTPELLTSKWNTKFSKSFRKVAIFFEKLSCKYADYLITVTEGCKNILSSRSAPSEKISLVLNTANTKLFQMDSERDFHEITFGAKLLYHGTVAERFGLHVLLFAMPAILKEIPGTVFRVYGKYDQTYKLYLENLVKELNLEQNVVLGGIKTHEELYELMKESDIEVVPNIANEYMNLSLPTKIFESAAAGLPVVSTRLYTVGLSFDDDTIMYAEDQNPEDFARKIIELCLNPEKRRNMSINAFKAIANISGDVMAERYLRLIERITGIKRKSTEGIEEEIYHSEDK